MEPERDQLKDTYRLCGLGFAINGLAMVLLTIDTISHTIFFTEILRTFRVPDWFWLFETSGWKWLIGAPISWFSLLGTYLLWGRWLEPSWQRRAGLLVVLNLADLVIWSMQYTEELGLGPKFMGHDWLVINTAAAMAWAELALTASLAADVCAHLGAVEVQDSARATRALIASATIFWFLNFFQRTDWNAGWPLLQARFSLELVFLFTGVLFLRSIAVTKVMLLSLTAARECFREVREMDLADRAQDPLISRSEAETELLPGQA